MTQKTLFPSISWNSSLYGVEIKAGKKHFVISAMPSMVGRLDTALKCCETMGNWRLPTFKEIKMVAESLQQINALMTENGGHRIDRESIMWISGDYGHSSSLKVNEGLCYILDYQEDTLCWWWRRHEFRLVMSRD